MPWIRKTYETLWLCVDCLESTASWSRKVVAFGSTVLPAALTRIVKRALGTADPYVASWVNDNLISTYSCEEPLETLRPVFTKLLAAHLSVNFAEYTYVVVHQEFLGLVTDDNGGAAIAL